jgi:hypothetical protein
MLNMYMLYGNFSITGDRATDDTLTDQRTHR